ncbi:metallophosphoesterase [Candidatus Moduliflexus flocculans]|uniref:Metallophosphoesterase n=1 Tax=Candidatus Moduliflexus flocculans TaxID=1499966 RepID=A0A0S6VT18_9BACT|nr:metallophosphoesterase [Candidatus Moduliflexus flocculans]
MEPLAIDPPLLTIRGGFLRSFEKNVAVIRAIGFNIELTIFRPSSTQYDEPLTLFFENIRGQEVEITSPDGKIENMLRSETDVLCDVTGLRTQKIFLSSSRASEEFDFLFIGDVHGMFHHFESVIESANQLDPLFIMANGDMTHSGRLEDFHAFADVANKATVPVFTSLGNHDKRAKGGRATYRDLLAPFYYSFSVNHSTFIVLDSSRKRGLQKFQYKWLERELQVARQKGDRIFVFLHRPPVCPKYNYLAFSASANAHRFLALMERYRVEIVFGSHIHVFTEFEKRGIRYVVTGGGGGALWQPQNVHHYLHVFVKRDGVDIRMVQLPTPEAKVSQRIKDVLKFNWDHHIGRNKHIQQMLLLWTALNLGQSAVERRERRWRRRQRF